MPSKVMEWNVSKYIKMTNMWSIMWTKQYSTKPNPYLVWPTFVFKTVVSKVSFSLREQFSWVWKSTGKFFDESATVLCHTYFCFWK